MNENQESCAETQRAEGRRDQRLVRCCYTCTSWHRRKNYACQHNGPWGGGTNGFEGCLWQHNGKLSPANVKLRHHEQRHETKSENERSK